MQLRVIKSVRTWIFKELLLMSYIWSCITMYLLKGTATSYGCKIVRGNKCDFVERHRCI